MLVRGRWNGGRWEVWVELTWIEEPTATPIARSILFLLATVTAVTCSAALPTIGRMISPINASLIGVSFTM
jgi:hypothetical protein